MIERALLISQGAELSMTHFPGIDQSPQVIEEPVEIIPENDSWNLEEIEKNHILKILKRFGGDKYEASNALGISLSSLYRKLDKFQQQLQT
jgi:DNA-binding NtrC family response regulator